MSPTAEAYDAVAELYAERLGHMGAVHDDDRDFAERWLLGAGGVVLDAGCGPGHWTGHLRAGGLEVVGLDLSHGILAQARTRQPGAPFVQGSLTSLPLADRTVAGALAWYSLIHLAPPHVDQALVELARVLRPHGVLVTGFFTGPDRAPFDHRVTPAWTWPVDEMVERAVAAGFVVVGQDERDGRRRHGALALQRRPDRS